MSHKRNTDDDGPGAGDMPEHIAIAVEHLRDAANALGCNASNIGLDHLDGGDRAYIEAVTLAGIAHGRIGAMLSMIAGTASRDAVETGQRTYPVAAVGSAAASSDIGSERVAASTLLGAFMPLAYWFRDHADTLPRAGAVWRLLVAATMLTDADTIADAEQGGYADRIGHVVDEGSEDEIVACAFELMREAVASIELETR